MKAELVPENGDPAIPIVRDVTVVGRHESCDVVIDNASLSKRHCVFVKTDGLLVLRDLATTNGTKVKGKLAAGGPPSCPEDRVSLPGAYKLARIYLSASAMRCSLAFVWVEQRRRARPKLASQPSPKRPVPGRHAPRQLFPPLPERPSSLLPEPSKDALTTAAHGNPNSAVPNGREVVRAGAAESNTSGTGFEIVEDDDDEIIDLD